MSEIIRELPWMKLAKEELGIKEFDGALANPRIQEYFTHTTYRAVSDEIPWCSAFVNFVMDKCGFPGTNSAAARSWLNWGDSIKEPRVGAIVVLSRGSNTYKGHVGFICEHSPYYSPFIKVLGGNQENKVCVKTYLKKDVLGYRWPKNYFPEA